VLHLDGTENVFLWKDEDNKESDYEEGCGSGGDDDDDEDDDDGDGDEEEAKEEEEERSENENDSVFKECAVGVMRLECLYL
jgi:hypothetical protein